MEYQFPFFPILFTFLLFIFMVFRIWKKSKTNHPAPHLPPGPWKLPLIGSMHHLVGSQPHHRLKDLAKKYGPLMHLQLGELTNIVISSPEIAKEVMKTHDVVFAQRPHLLAASVTSYNYTDIAFAPYGDYWRQMRKLCTLELLTAKRVQSFRSIREEEVSRLMRSLSSSAGSPINFSRMFNSLTYSIISRASFGKIWKGEEIFIPIVKKLIVAAGGFTLADVYPSVKLLHWISGMAPRLKRIHHIVDNIFQNIIDDHRTKRAAANSSVEGEGDLVDVLLNFQAQEDLAVPITNDNIKGIILDTFVAGSETSSTTAEWAMSELLKNPRVMEKAQEEVRRVFGEEGNVHEGRLHELNYLKWVINETLRLHPPIPLLLPRECRESCVINGYDIPVKSKVIVNVWAIGRDPNCWMDAEKFYPERFQDCPIDYKGTHFEFLPFGAGRRMCPGILFGIINVEFPLAQLLYHFDWKLPTGVKPETFDMTEDFGAVVKRKSDLYVIPMPFLPPPVK
ncbi:premnaspirodiene oxygenase [Ricinus communis]|uniref:Cytochrome P450, putative n=1 Tax=Ricinus communis TaxID=3988 RepID=B9S9U3_RICCO|nr:premnaspirodiene oxygenase [Ricinus communis]EEF39613.1 cytochrome P450, putative [Ricinus communis]|eukprot:XP_002522762.1 premnaspirodiene oxygenase [Ricinus communis]